MTVDEKIKIVRVMINSDITDDSDDVISTYLLLAGRKIIARAYPYSSDVEDVPSRYDFNQCEIAAYLLNKRGAEGQTSHSENGISRSYENADVPSSMLACITPYCGVIK